MTEYKGYNIEGDGTFGMKLIKTIGRGSLPLELRGTFTTASAAMLAIDISLIEKGKTNAEVVISN